MNIAATMTALGRAARDAATTLAATAGEQRDAALAAAAAELRRCAARIVDANRQDTDAARERGLGSAMLDRLMLDDGRVEAMAAGIETVIGLDDPLGRVLDDRVRPNGLRIQRVAVPLGVIGIVYESRPNVTADAAALCIKSGNAAILRGGSESFRSSAAIYECLRDGLEAAGLPAAAVQMVPTTDREAVGFLLSSMASFVDVVVPRGGRSLIERVRDDARVPVIGHLEGICHVYLHAAADPGVARDVVLNAKMRRTGICGAAETLLVDRDVAEALLPGVSEALLAAGCEIRGDETGRSIVPEAAAASDADWSTEYLDAIVSIRAVDDIDAAIDHIRRYGSAHTESIVTADAAAAGKFLREVDSAIVMHNASTQFADGGEFGFGAEIGIATGKTRRTK